MIFKVLYNPNHFVIPKELIKAAHQLFPPTPGFPEVDLYHTELFVSAIQEAVSY